MTSTPGATEARARRQRVDAARLSLLERAERSSLTDLLTATLDLAEGLTGSRIGFFHFVDDDQVGLRLQAWSTNTVARMCTAQGAGQHYPLDRAGVWVDCVRLGRPVVHNDYPSLEHRKGLPPGHAPVVRELTVPVLRGEKVCAVLGIGNKPSDYDDRDVEDVSALADLAWDIAARKRAEEALRASLARQERLVAELRAALGAVKTLSGLLPICMYCKKIRDDQGYWDQVENYITSHTDALFTHGMCEECYQKHKDD